MTISLFGNSKIYIEDFTKLKKLGIFYKYTFHLYRLQSECEEYLYNFNRCLIHNIYCKVNISNDEIINSVIYWLNKFLHSYRIYLKYKELYKYKDIPTLIKECTGVIVYAS